MASIPGAIFKVGKIHDDLNRFRKRSASDILDRRPEEAALKLEMDFRQRSVSMTTPPSTPLMQTPISGLSPAVSGDSIRSLVGNFVGSFNSLLSKRFDGSAETVAEDHPANVMRVYPTAGSITDLAHHLK